MGSSSRFLLFPFSLLLIFLATDLTLSLNDPYFEHSCNTIVNCTANSPYQENLNTIVSEFSSLTDFNSGFFNLSAGKNPDMVYSIALCRGDINQTQCNYCLNYTATELMMELCPSAKEATAWSEFCLVRYANRDMYGQLENDPRTCAYNPENATNPQQFNQTLSELLDGLSSKAATGGPLRKFAAGNSQSVYAMVQCTPDLDEQNCTTCLNFGKSELLNCCYGRIGCRVLRPNCILRFESTPFFNPSAVLSPSPLLSPVPPSPTSFSSFPTSPPPASSSSSSLSLSNPVNLFIYLLVLKSLHVTIMGI